MAADAAIEVQTGESRWLRISRHALFLVTVVALVSAPTNPPWEALAIAGLLLAYSLVCLEVRRMAGTRALRLLTNGSVTLSGAGRYEQYGVLGQTHWASARLSVVTVSLFDRRRPLRLVVCRSLNHPDDYRRLLAQLRLGAGRQSGSGILDRA